MNAVASPLNLRSGVVSAVKKGLSGGWVWRYLAREWSAGEILVLTYHQVGDAGDGAPITSAQFAQQMDWLAERCDFVDAGMLPEFFAGATRSKKPRVLLTFDDGHRCLYENVYPILKERSLAAVAFLATGPISKGEHLWTDEVRLRLAAAPVTFELPVAARELLPAQDNRRHFARTLVAGLKRCSNAERLSVIEALREVAPLAAGPPAMISWDQARTMGDVFHWGAHTHSHPILSRVTPADALQEIRTGRQRIVEETGQAVNLFAYPNGTPADYNHSVQEILRQEGFIAAFTTIPGAVSRDDNPFELRRCPTTASSIGDFAWLAARPSRAS